MLSQYIQAAMRRAKYEILEDDGSYYGEIPGFQGVYSNAPLLEDCRTEQHEILAAWILLHLSDHTPLPEVDGLKLETSRVPEPELV